MENEANEPSYKYNYNSPAEHPIAERSSEEKREYYYCGQMPAMGGPCFNHSRINENRPINIATRSEGKDELVTCSAMYECTESGNQYVLQSV